MKQIYTVGFALMVLLSMTMSAAASVQYKQKTIDNGYSADALWSDISSNTYLNVYEYQGQTQIYVDICAADYSSCKLGTTFTSNNVFDENKKLSTATLSSVTIDMVDTSTGLYVDTLTIQAGWTGVGSLTTTKSTSSTKSGDITSKYSSHTLFTSATSTGTINGQSLGTSQFADLYHFDSVSIITIK